MKPAKPTTRLVAENPVKLVLDLLAQLPDKAVSDWGLAYDWTAPVAVSCVIDAEGSGLGALYEQWIQSAPIVLDHPQTRLADLLIRPDMFSNPLLQRSRADSDSPRKKTTEDELGFSPVHLWAGLIAKACANGNADLLRRLGQMGVPGLPAYDRQAFLAVGASIGKCPLRAKKAVIDALLETKLYAENLRKEPISPEVAKFIISIVDNTPARDVVATLRMLGGKPPQELLRYYTDIPQTKVGFPHRIRHGLQVAAAAMELGGFNALRSDGTMATPVNDFGRAWPEIALAKLVAQAASGGSQANARDGAKVLLAWVKEGRGWMDSKELHELTRILSEGSAVWDEPLLDMVRQVCPTPSPGEVLNLLLKSDPAIFEARLEDVLPETMKGGWITDFSAALYSEPNSSGKDLSSRAMMVGQLLGHAQDASRELCRLIMERFLAHSPELAEKIPEAQAHWDAKLLGRSTPLAFPTSRPRL